MNVLPWSLFAVTALCVCGFYWLTAPPSSTPLPTSSPPLAGSKTSLGGRRADDGRFHARHKYRTYIYSSFYDDRPSLDYSERRVVLIGLAYGGRGQVDGCRVWYDDGHDSGDEIVSVPATTINIETDYEVVYVCHLNATTKAGVARRYNNNGTAGIPAFVALTRGGRILISSRVPVELIQRVERKRGRHRRRDRLLLCVPPVTGSPMSARQLVEWIEMQRLVGVDGIVVYERAMSRSFRRALDAYRGIVAAAAAADDDDGFLLDVRQAQIERGDAFECQIPATNDCMYRYGGRFDYVAAVDLDELIVPRGNFTDLVNLFEHLSAAVNRTVGQFTFANVLYLVGLPPDYRLLAGNGSGSSVVDSSFYLSRLNTAAVSAGSCNAKYVVDSDACVAMGTHRCRTFTPGFTGPTSAASTASHRRRRSGLAVLDVDPDIGRKHHYRSTCNLDNLCDGSSADECERAMRTPIVDEVVAKYGKQLTRRLAQRYRQLAGRLT